ncbi:Uncharacterized protein FKW44_003186 [Caligus rogercresseyi]|uniref:Uncharacterized protein n=1 Tax=Caligus rogercresseyi TaxID=217165 RepID=A0A7T8QWR9_CALRO|nr:Uncharacterized protein FKW44_003186 [Caligus rogercresseyi]
MGCSKQTIANTINKDLGYSSYKTRLSPTSRGRPRRGCWRISPTTGAQTCGPPASLTAAPSTISSGAWSRTRDSLRAAIVEEFANMKKDVVAKACGRFRHGLELVVALMGAILKNKYLYTCAFHLTKKCWKKFLNKYVINISKCVLISPDYMYMPCIFIYTYIYVYMVHLNV